MTQNRKILLPNLIHRENGRIEGKDRHIRLREFKEDYPECNKICEFDNANSLHAFNSCRRRWFCRERE